MFRRMISPVIAGISALAFCLFAPAPAAAAGIDDFARDAAIGGIAEVELGRLAVQKAASPKVRQFGQKMIDDHSKANADLQTAAQTQGIALPTEIDSRHKAKMGELSKLSGFEFDKAYMKDMVKDHEKDVAEFEKAAKMSGDTPVRGFAEKALPTLREHLRMAREVSQSLGM